MFLWKKAFTEIIGESTKEGRIILYDAAYDNFGIDELNCVREPTDSEWKEIIEIKERRSQNDIKD